MKRASYLMIAIILLLQGASSIRAQNTGGTEFWLTFGANYGNTNLDLQIRIISGNQPATGSIHFTSLGTSVSFNIVAQQIYTYRLDSTQKEAVLNTTMGVTNRSVHVTSNEPVTVYAMNQALRSADVTNIFPVTALGTNYYQISYTPHGSFSSDAYAIIATRNNTHVFHNGILAVTLNTGHVYYRTSGTDMTGAHITSNNPVAFFALNQGTQIPRGYDFVDCLIQQLPPVDTWGKNFFVPVSNRTRDIVRIIASQNNTNITQVGGTLLYFGWANEPYRFASRSIC